MNTAMWLHPVTKKQIQILEREWSMGEESRLDVLGDGSVPSERWVRPWAHKALACGDVESGVMMEEILSMVRQLDSFLAWSALLA